MRGGDHLKDPGVDGMVVLKWMLKKWDGGGGGHVLDRSDLGQGQVTGFG
jgi:hypothetical protein